VTTLRGSPRASARSSARIAISARRETIARSDGDELLAAAPEAGDADAALAELVLVSNGAMRPAFPGSERLRLGATYGAKPLTKRQSSRHIGHVVWPWNQRLVHGAQKA
jgi:hypothetical protein